MLGATILVAAVLCHETPCQQLAGPARRAGPLIAVTTLADGTRIAEGELLVTWRAGEGHEFAACDAVAALGGWVGERLPRHRLLRTAYDSKDFSFLEIAAARLRDCPDVEQVDFNSVGQAAAGFDEACPDATAFPSDPFFPDQWHLLNTGQNGGKVGADIDLLTGWQVAMGSSGVVVAILDTGTQLDHPEFEGRLLPGYDFVYEDDDPDSGNPHAVEVMALLGAVGCNEYGVVGVDQHCKLMPLQVLDDGGSGTVFDLIEALDFVSASPIPVDVVSMSLQGYPKTGALKAAFKELKDSGHVLVAAAGNWGDGKADAYFPAASESVLTIGFTKNNDVRHSVSATGNSVDFVAPGHKVVTAYANVPGSETTAFTGSSAATPLVAGIASILRGLNPTLSPDAIVEFIRLGAEDQVGDAIEDTPGWDPYYGHGRVSLGRTLTIACSCTGTEELISFPSVASATALQTVTLLVDLGREFALQPYWILGCASAPGAGLQLGQITLPLIADSYFRYTIEHANGDVLLNTQGSLDHEGRAVASIVLPANAPLSGTVVLHHAVVVFDGAFHKASAQHVSNLAVTEIGP